MKAIMISIKPKYCELIMNGKKTVEVRKNKALSNAIQKLIDKNGYADVYVYCTKTNKHHWYLQERYDHSSDDTLGYSTPYYTYVKVADIMTQQLDGKVLFKFRCYNVEEIDCFKDTPYPYCYSTDDLLEEQLENKSCLSYKELENYLEMGNGYAIHISNLEIFDKPKELSMFRYATCPQTNCEYCKYNKTVDGDLYCTRKTLNKAPQNFCYVEVH